MDTSNLIKDSNIPGCLAIDKCKKENMALSGYNKVSRIMVPVFLMIAYRYYSNMCLCKKILNNNANTYEVSEFLSCFVNDFLGLDTKVSDFVKGDNELADEALENFEHFSEMIEAIKLSALCEKEDVFYFMEKIESGHVKKLDFLKEFEVLYYPYWCNMVVNYVSNQINKEDMWEGFFVPSINLMDKRQASRKDIIKFIRNMINLREAFYKMIDKRKKGCKNN